MVGGSSEKEDRFMNEPQSPRACMNCGYDLRELSVSGDCPECGVSIRQSIKLSTSHSTESVSLRGPFMLIICITAVNAVWGASMYWQFACELWFGTIAGLNGCAAVVGILILVTGRKSHRLGDLLPVWVGFLVMVGLLTVAHFAVFARMCAG